MSFLRLGNLVYVEVYRALSLDDSVRASIDVHKKPVISQSLSEFGWEHKGVLNNWFEGVTPRRTLHYFGIGSQGVGLLYLVENSLQVFVSGGTKATQARSTGESAIPTFHKYLHQPNEAGEQVYTREGLEQLTTFDLRIAEQNYRIANRSMPGTY